MVGGRRVCCSDHHCLGGSYDTEHVMLRLYLDPASVGQAHVMLRTSILGVSKSSSPQNKLFM